MPPSPHSQRGFTLVEMIMVIVITGIIGGMVAVFIKSPIDSYIDMARRTELTDVADTAVRRMARDIRLALPNSVRNPSGVGQDQCVEFIPTKTGGRYRAAQTAGGAGDILDFSLVDTGFDMLGPNTSPPTGQSIAAGDVIVVYNDGYSGNAYTGSNAVKVSIAPVEAVGPPVTTAITFVAAGVGAPFNGKQFPAESPSFRFQVIPAAEHVVSYICSGGILYRSAITLAAAHAQPAACPAVPAGTPILATNLASCSIKYEPPGSGSGGGRFGIVSISLAMRLAGETVNLYHQVHVDNTP